MRLSEVTLLGHLSDPDSLDELAREGFLAESVRETIPTDWVRRILAWALERFFADGRSVAPSRQAISEVWADTLERYEVVLPEVDVEQDTVGLVIEDLRANHARVQAEKLGIDFAQEMGAADGPARVGVFTDYAERFYATAQSLISRRNEADGYIGVRDALLRFGDRATNGAMNRGMHLGIDLVDEHMHGTHPGEVTVVCSESGVGKSFLAGWCLLTEWRRGRKAVLVTLENDPEMTFDRLVCMACCIPYEAFQLGRLADHQLAAVLALLDEMEASSCRPVVTQIEASQRTVAGVVRKAQLEGADSLIIDQLSFLRPAGGSKTLGRNFQVMEIMQELKSLVNEGATKIPVLLLVQLNREGAKAALASGRYRQSHLAESSGVNQTADAVWAIYQSEELSEEDAVQFQCLKARRFVVAHFEIDWRPHLGDVRGRFEVDLSKQEGRAK